MNEEEENKMTIGEICRVVAKRIWIVLGASLAAAAIAALCMAFVINPMCTYYTMTFDILYPTSETAKYPDGAPFYDSDMISVAFLTEAKESDRRFAGLDLNKMLKEDAISLSVGLTGSYTLTVKGSYFSDTETAEAFIRAVANVPVARIKENANTVDYFVADSVFDAVSFEEQMELLTQQKETLLAKYAEWIALYSETYTVEGKTLLNHRAALTGVYGESTRSAFEEEFETNGYDQINLNSYLLLVPDVYATREDAIQAAIYARILQLKNEQELNEMIITRLKDLLNGASEGSADDSAAAYETYAATLEDGSESTTVVVGSSDLTLSQMLAKFEQRQAKIEYQCSVSLTVKNVQAFADRLKGQYEMLANAAETLTRVTASIYAQNSSVVFETQKAETEGDKSTIFITVVVFLLVFIAASAIVCASDAKRGKRELASAPRADGEERAENGAEKKE